MDHRPSDPVLPEYLPVCTEPFPYGTSAGFHLLPYPFLNSRHVVPVGGFMPDRYTENQIPFFLWSNGFRDTFGISTLLQLDLRYGFGRKHYITARGVPSGTSIRSMRWMSDRRSGESVRNMPSRPSAARSGSRPSGDRNSVLPSMPPSALTSDRNHRGSDSCRLDTVTGPSRPEGRSGESAVYQLEAV